MGLIIAHMGFDHLGVSPVVVLFAALAFMGVSLALALRQPVEKDEKDADEASDPEKVADIREPQG